MYRAQPLDVLKDISRNAIRQLLEDEEAMAARFGLAVPLRVDAAEVGPSAAAAKAAWIQELRDENKHPDSPSLHYSRACGICRSQHPQQRAALVACGHLMCAACALRLEMEADYNAVEEGDVIDGTFPCPFCRRRTSYVQIYEELEDATNRERQEHSC